MKAMERCARVAFTLALLIAGASVIHAQWESRRSDLPDWENGQAISVIDSNTAVVSANGVHRTIDAGLHWMSLGGPSGMWTPCDVSAPDTSAVWAAMGDGRILKWEQSSGSWLEQYRDTNATTFMNYVKMFDTQHGIAMGDARNTSGPAIFLRTTDGGTHWVSVNDSAFGGYSGSVWNRLDFLSLDVGYFFESGVYPQKLYKTTDGCQHWEATALPESLYVEGMNFYSAELGLAHSQVLKNVNGNWIYSRYIARTIDGGASWQVFDAPENIWGGVFAFLPENPAKVWMTDDVKLYFSADTGRTWTEKLDKGGRDIQFTDSLYGWMLGDKGVLYYTSNGGDPPSAVRSRWEGPRGFALEQNYPNPFSAGGGSASGGNPTTRIRYIVGRVVAPSGASSSGVEPFGSPRRSTLSPPEGRVQWVEGPAVNNVRLIVYDVLGREVAVLVNERKAPGMYEVTFDASGLASGTYLYRMTAGSFQETKPMLLLK
jgi:photosystem II stability/assembly factor-like uncharacterized protein